jgi:hypothetical protein
MVFREMIKDRILTERILSTKELYSNTTYNTQTFTELWGEHPVAKHLSYLHRKPKTTTMLQIQCRELWYV